MSHPEPDGNDPPPTVRQEAPPRLLAALLQALTVIHPPRTPTDCHTNSDTLDDISVPAAVFEGIAASSALNSDLVGKFFWAVARDLEDVGLTPDEVEPYIRAGEKTLASLYQLAKAPGTPSPSELRKLALQYAIDARVPIDDLLRFDPRRTEEGWRVVVYHHAWDRLLGLETPGKLIRNPFAQDLLGCVASEPPALSRILDIVEKVLRKAPQAHDGWPQPGKPIFEYDVHNGRVRLWIDDRKVTLPARKDLNSLLLQLCLRGPVPPPSGRRPRQPPGYTNVAQAAKDLRRALEQVFPGAEEWLVSRPYRWADDYVPVHRR